MLPDLFPISNPHIFIGAYGGVLNKHHPRNNRYNNIKSEPYVCAQKPKSMIKLNTNFN